jgi:integrase
MALYQRGRIWYADYYVHGNRVQVTTGTSSKREAEKVFARLRCDIPQWNPGGPVRITFEEFSERYMEHSKLHKRSWLRDEQMLRHLNPFFAGCQLGDLSPLAVERYKRERAKMVSPATVNRELALVKHMFNMATTWGQYSGLNPVRAVRFLPEDNFQFRTLSEDEERKLLACCSPYLQDLVVFAINTGLRLGDMLNLKWEEVDVERSILRRTVQKNRRVLELPLNETAGAVVSAWCGMKKCSYVFYNPETGDRFKDLWLGLKKACRKAGLEDVTWHTFRHTFASRLTRKGADLVTVKELLGHSDVSVTMRYAHTNAETKAKAVQLLSSSDKVVTIAKKKRKTA